MAWIEFAPHLAHRVGDLAAEVPGATLREALTAAFAERPDARGYVLDDQGRLRKHVVVFIDGHQLVDRVGLTDPIGPTARLFVAQALSGG